MSASKQNELAKKIIEQEKQKRLHEQKIKDLQNYSGEDEVVSAYDLWEELKEQGLTERQPTGTGFGSLDKMLEGGFCGGDLCVIGGYTNMGKTPFMLNLAYNLSNNNCDSLFFSFEMSAKNLLVRMNPEQNPTNLQFFLPKKIIPNKLEWLFDRILEAKYKKHIQAKAVFIDFLDHIVEFKKGDNEEQAIRETMKQLHNFALAEDLIIFVASHVTKADKEKRKSAPDKADLKGSQAIDGYAEYILMIQRLAQRENGEIKFVKNEIVLGDETRIYIRKNRLNGQCKFFDTRHDIKTKRFLEIDTQQEEELTQNKIF